MKRIILAALIILSLSLPAWAAQDWVIPSTTQTADAAVLAGPGYFHGITVITDATNAVTVDIYDNATAASGTKLLPTWTVTTSSTNRAQTYSVAPPVKLLNGIYVDITCSGTVSYMVYYSQN